MERISRTRAIILLLFFVMILVLFSVKLFELQIVEAEGTDNTTKFVSQTRVKASRGDILDRNGNILVGNRASYDLVFNHDVIKSSTGTNESLLRLVHKCWELGIEYIDHFPVTTARPYEYTLSEYTTAWQGYFQRYLREREMDSDITATLLVQRLRERYKIPEDWTDEEARAVVGLRYEFDLRGVANLSNYIFIEDVSNEDLSALLELNIPGLMVEPSTVREYYTKYAAHILGTMGAMTADQWLEVKEAYENGTGDEYYMDAQIGQSGIEAAFEEYLHGVDGLRRDEVDKNGAIISQEYYPGKEPRAGNNLELTVDINLQQVAEEALEELIEYLKDPEQNESGEGSDVEGASVVVLNKYNEVLAMASYPTYDPRTYNENYEEILAQDFDPLYNRALMGAYYPGSVFKPCTLIAAMNAGKYYYGETILDEGIFIKEGYEGFTPKCLTYSNYGYTHGTITSTKALEASCNYFFYELGFRITNEQLNETAKALGLGEPTGVELNESLGYRANPESKAATHKGMQATWFKGDQIQASIGQSTNMFTPMQLAVYCSTLANEGVRYKATFLKRVVSSDYRSLIEENQPEVVNILEMSDDTIRAYTEGMIAVIEGSGDYNQGTARNTMAGLPVQVAAKTGTAQTGRGTDDGSFICFAPVDDPEIIIAVQAEKAAHGSTLGRVAKTILEYYFSTSTPVGEVSEAITYENQPS